MSGRTLLAEEMYGFGVINHIYPASQFIEKVTAFAASFTNKLSDRLQAIKQITQLNIASIPRTAQETESEALVRFYESKEGQERIQEFYKKSQEKKK